MTVLFFFAMNIVVLLKLILYLFVKLVVLPEGAKALLILLFMLLLNFLIRSSKKRFKTLSALRNYKKNKLRKYALKTMKEHVYNFIILLIGSFVFFIGFFFLRVTNKEKTLDIVEKITQIADLYLITTFFDFALTCILFLLLSLLYVLIIIKFMNYFRFHIIKRHLYLIGGENTTGIENWYQHLIFNNRIERFNLYDIHFQLCFFKIPTLYKTFYFSKKIKVIPLEFASLTKSEQEQFSKKSPVDPYYFVTKFHLDKILLHIMTKCHYYILLFCFFYDCYFNNFNIHLVFLLLPWTLFYDIYLRISKFFDGLHLAYDTYINTVIYANSLEVINDDTWLIDGEFYNLKNFKHIYATYICNNFVKDVSTLSM
jgi:hypothetical protein